jgi:putative ABC transport system permease protein
MPNWNHIVREHLAVLRLPPEREIEIVEEQALHLEAAYEDALAAGLSEAEAEARAVRSYDWRLLECELSRAEQPLATRALQPSLEMIERKGGMRMESFIQDLRYGARMLMKRPGFTLIAALTLALGIGANTAIFSMANALLLRSLPVPQPAELVTVSRGDGTGEPLSYPDFVALRERNGVLAGLAASHFASVSFGNGSRSEMLRGELVSSDYFDVLRLQPVLGRGFLPEEERSVQPVVVLSHGLWQSRFGADPQIIGQTITLHRLRYTVIGVAPAGFNGMTEMFRTDLWLPLMMLPQARPMFLTSLSNRHDQVFAAIGRLKPGVSLAQAQTAIETINRGLELAEPPPVERRRDPNEDRSLKLWRPQGIGLPHFRRRAQLATTLLFVVVGIVLLIACANVANLLLARAAARRKEIAVRLALGASRFRLIRQLLTESAMLGLLGACGGLPLAFWINRALMALKPPLPESWGLRLDLQLDATALGFTLSLALAVSLLFGLAPALAASKPDVVPALKDETGAESRRGRFRRFNLRYALVVSQISVSLVLLIVAGLFVRSLQQMHKVDPGFQTENRLALSFSLDQEGYDEPKGREFSRQLLERVRALPGVQTASLANYLPLGFMALSEPVTVDGRETPHDARPPFAAAQIIGPDYFRAIGTPLVRGRDFTPQDSANAPAVAIINETMARRFWPNEDPIGKRLRIGNPESDPQPREIIGVVKDTVIRSIGEEPKPVTYRPLAQQHSQWLTLVVHTAGNPKALLPAVRREVQAIDENLPAQEIKTLDEIVAFSFWPMRMGAGLVGTFGLLGLLLASVGLYGVMSYAVAARTREIGVRMALGAERGDVLRLIVGQGLALALLGAGAGLLLAYAVTRVLQQFLFGIGATDPLTFTGVALLLTMVALLACWIPARRATKVDPLTALRHE